MAVALLTGPVHAHFVFIVPQKDGTSVKVVFSEDLEPDEGVDIEKIAGLKLNALHDGGKQAPVECKIGEHCLVGEPGLADPRVVFGSLDYGVLRRGDAKPFLLKYHPKAVLPGADETSATLGENAPLELVPVLADTSVTFKLLAAGKPVPEAEVTVLKPDGEKEKVQTDKDGRTRAFTESGRYVARARHDEIRSGEHDGQKYDEVRHYATLVVDLGTPLQQVRSDAAPLYPPLPQAVSSFGAAVCDGWAYVYGGHAGKAHEYSTDTVIGAFLRLKLDGGKTWEELPGDAPLQGLALVAHQGRLYRIGGMQPRNKPGDKADNHSLSTCARFDPAARKWEPLPDLPEGRSSHDAVVVGDRVHVAGGWRLKGVGVEPVWHDTALVLDLANNDPKWEPFQQPFQRRALTAAAFQDKVYVIAGLSPDAKTHLTVNVYDPAQGEWTTGPDIPGPPMNGFTPASCVAGGRLYLTPADGKVLRLSERGDAWEEVGQLKEPRFVHRMLPVTDDCLLVVGGASRKGNVALTETIAPLLKNHPK
jgi:uncharacterized GH25 family protein/N-acetylneuraminic acid mutarotase